MPPQYNQQFKSFFSTLQNDLRNSNAYANFRKESKEVTDFYLTDSQREELKRMKRIKGSFYITGWVLKAMFYKLTPVRRIMFVVGTLLLININVTSNSVQGNSILGSIFLILVILMELKDKLLAHDELEAGRKIQETLMPERMPKANGWSLWLYTRSANEVCGDLIDFLKLEPGAFSIAMADVSGKGLHAALITAKLQATIRALAGEIRSLPELIGRINAIVHRDSPSHIFSSLLYAECSESNGTVRYVNAGHFPALIIRVSGVEECVKGDAALGLVGTMKFSEHSTSLNSGDAIVLYSDGLTEAQNAAGEFFGKERLISILTSITGTPEERGFAVLREVDRFTGTAAPTDDLSLIVAQKL
ncbi:MAG: PP2C family protein-serine/threonine phosphatase [Bacteroidota bacterium]